MKLRHFTQCRLQRKIKALDEFVFIKQVLLHPRDRLKKRVRELEDEIRFVKHVPSHPRDRLKRAVAALNERLDELQFIKQKPLHPRDWLKKVQNSGDVQFIRQQPVHLRDRLFKKAKDLKAEKMDLQVTKYVPGDVQFLKQSVHPRYRMRYKLKNNQQRPYDKDIITKVTPMHPRDRLKRKIAARKKEVLITKTVPPHIVIDSDDDAAQITKVTPAHPRYRLQRALRNAPKSSVDKRN